MKNIHELIKQLKQEHKLAKDNYAKLDESMIKLRKISRQMDGIKDFQTPYLQEMICFLEDIKTEKPLHAINTTRWFIQKYDFIRKYDKVKANEEENEKQVRKPNKRIR